ILVILTVMLTAVAAWCGPVKWEESSRPVDNQAVHQQVDSEGVEIMVKDGWVYVTASRPVTIRIFSILGQPIITETMQPGTYRLHLASRGIYILRVGSATRRITI
ncbi:MAG: T9SS type A sorting domain-containing protein, partial [Muribaculaceae bacterium]|nr:T9SS type A sorting domain-containing protein [Muribaculaceae bacterium]